MGCALGCAKLLPRAVLLLGETKQNWGEVRSLEDEVLDSSTVKAFSTTEWTACCRCIQ